MMLVRYVVRVLAAAALLASPLSAQDAARGRTLFEKCLACHAVGQGAQSKNGPHLNGLIGRKFGGAADFEYSEAFQSANAKGTVWTEEQLSTFLAAPLEFLPKNKMAFGAVKDETQRADIIAYLKSLQ